MTRYIPIFIATTLALGGCTALQAPLAMMGLQEQVDLVNDRGTDALAKAIDTYCATEFMFPQQRMGRLADLNAKTKVGWMTPLDCNRDGVADIPPTQPAAPVPVPPVAGQGA